MANATPPVRIGARSKLKVRQQGTIHRTSMFQVRESWIFAVAGFLCFCPQTANGTCDTETISRYPGWPKDLDINLYWIGPDDKTEKATGKPSEYYDPAKNTVILMDGWDGWDKVSTCHRLSSVCPESAHCPDETVFSRGWLEQGYNFGIFYWDQFADTTCTIDAEALIWDKDGDWRKGPWHDDDTMSWKSYDVETHKQKVEVYNGPEASIGRICAKLLQAGMPTFSGNILHFVGLSIGAQLASACALELHQTINHPVLPTRLTLLEPIFTDFLKGMSTECFGRGWDWKYTTRRTMFAIKSLWLRGVPMELYKSSVMTEWPMLLGWNPALEMETLGTVVYYDPRYCGFGLLSYQCRHEAAVPIYFLRMGSPAGECVIPGPRCTESQLKDLISRQQENLTKGEVTVFNQVVKGGSRVVYTQVKGRGTYTSKDDEFVTLVKALPTDARLPKNASDLLKIPVRDWPFHRLVEDMPSKNIFDADAPVMPTIAFLLLAAFATIACGCLVLKLFAFAHVQSSRSRDLDRADPEAQQFAIAMNLEDSEDGNYCYE